MGSLRRYYQYSLGRFMTTGAKSFEKETWQGLLILSSWEPLHYERDPR